MEDEVLAAIKLDEAKARGGLGPLIVAVAKLAEEIGMLLKLLSQAHRTGEACDRYFDTELGDVAYQVSLLCRRRGKSLEEFLQQGRERFQERLELGERW